MILKEILKSDDLMHHRIQFTTVPNRREWLTKACKQQSVLHVGCCDVPIFDPNNNLHIDLGQVTDQLDGLDVSEEGIIALKRHVCGSYFLSPREVHKDYDLLLAPEVLEHISDPHSFLQGLFSIRARRYLITAPNFQWYAQAKKQGDCFIEEVHGDHRAWYSPYTLLNTIRPFINEEEDQVEVFLIEATGSVAVEITKARKITPQATTNKWLSEDLNVSIHDQAKKLIATDQTAEALCLLGWARQKDPDVHLYYLQARTLLDLGRSMDTFRLSVEFMAAHPSDTQCLRFAAAAAEDLGQEQAALDFKALAARYE